jgi:hypothetical protein
MSDPIRFFQFTSLVQLSATELGLPEKATAADAHEALKKYGVGILRLTPDDFDVYGVEKEVGK